MKILLQETLPRVGITGTSHQLDFRQPCFLIDSTTVEPSLQSSNLSDLMPTALLGQMIQKLFPHTGQKQK